MGALFGIAASGTSLDTTKIYFNDDNDNTVKVLTNAGLIGSLPITTIGSTVDPMNGDSNPYGLAVVPVTSGLLTQGDLLVCNFNDDGGVQGNGTTIEMLSPTPGSSPTRFVQDPNLKGCAALALSAQSDPWATGNTANLAPFYDTSGTLISSALRRRPGTVPGARLSVRDLGPFGSASFFVSNLGDGSLVRIDIADGGFNFDTIATGFSVNGGAPGNILAPAGLTYDATSDTLFVVDSNQNRVVSLASVSSIPANGVQVQSDGGFTGPSALSASVLYSGPPLNAPLSAAELFNGDLVVGNTADNNLIEISRSGNVTVGTQNLDTGPTGALFGIAATGTSQDTMKIYFNDDNDNTVKVLSP